MTDTEELLERVAYISAKYPTNDEGAIEPLNLFRILRVEADERRMCRVLRELLSPSGTHGMGGLFLRLFMRDVLGRLDVHDDELEGAIVEREYTIDNGRKIDLVIRTRDRFIPIEVKIFAGDLPNQYRDYARRCRNAKLVYLSRLGGLPDAWSTDGMNTDDIICVSFKDDILRWLEDCMSQSDVIENARVLEALRQFAEAVEDFTMPLCPIT